MNSLLFLCALASVLVLAALNESGKLQKTLRKRAGKTNANHWAHAISMLVLTVQIGEMVKVIEHVSVVNLAAAFLLLAIAVAARSGTGSESHG